MKYVKSSFLRPRESPDLAILNAQVQRSVLKEADLHAPGANRDLPREHFARKGALLTRLLPIAPDLGAWAVACSPCDFHLQFDSIL